MDERIRQILDILRERDIVTADAIADRLGVTARTVRSLLSRSQRHLSAAGVTIESKPGAGYHLVVHNAERFGEFSNARPRQGLPRTSAERVRYLMELLLTARDDVRLDEVSEALFVSKKTLAQDLHKVEGTLGEYGLLLDRKPYHGIKVVGSEFDVRHCLASSFQQLDQILGTAGFPLDEITREVLDQQVMAVSERSRRNLVVHLAVAIKRVRSGNPLRGAAGEMAGFVTEREVEVAEALLEAVSRAAGIEFPRDEVSYLALNLAGKRILRDSTSAESEIKEEARAVVNEMLTVLDETYGFGLASDRDLAVSLIQHVIPLFVRLRFGMRLANPVLQQIKEAYPLAFVMAAQAATVLMRDQPRPVTDDELGYIAMWLALSLERRRPKPRRKRVLLVCASGVGSARLLEFAIRDRFGDLIESIRVVQVHELSSTDLAGVDVVFTTVPLAVDSLAPVHLVHDFLEQTDQVEIRRALMREPSASIIDYLAPRLFLPHLKADTREAVIRALADACRSVHDLPELFAASVLRREEISSTDFGNLVAMPHAEVAMSPETFICVGILDDPITWSRHEVQVVFLVSISSREGQDLRRFYGALSRFLMDSDSVASLISNRDFDQLVEALRSIEQKVEIN